MTDNSNDDYETFNDIISSLDCTMCICDDYCRKCGKCTENTGYKRDCFAGIARRNIHAAIVELTAVCL